MQLSFPGKKQRLKQFKYMMKLLEPPVKRIAAIFLVWRLLLVVLSVVVIKFLPFGNEGRYLGGGINIYQKLPNLFAWANFDGEHYLSIAVFGYKNLQQAFFPVYPKIMAILSYPFDSSIYLHYFTATIAGLFVSNLSLVTALILLYKLIKLDFSEKIALWSVIILLIFPTSFFLGSVYSESLFLLLTVAAFYSSRKKQWLLAGVFAGMASATRVIGILIFPALLTELILQKESLKNSWGVLLAPLGLLLYMLYLWLSIGDPIAFYHLQKIVGNQHQFGVVLLPQVYYRYLRILFTAKLPIMMYQTVALEFITGVLFILLPIYGYFKKIRLSYLIFALTGVLMPSIPGSFSSLPRYVLVLFPSFIIMAVWIQSFPFWSRIVVITLLTVILGLETTLFIRGYWVA